MAGSEESKTKKVMTTLLKVGATAGLAAFTVVGIEQSFGSGSEESETKKVMTTLLAVGATAGLAAFTVVSIAQSFGSGSKPGETSKDKGKMMKAPGRDSYMPRKDFQDNPSAYFRGLRGKKS